MERGRGAVEADIADEIAAFRFGIDAFEIGALMQKAARHQNGEKIGFRSESVGQGNLRWQRGESGATLAPRRFPSRGEASD